MSHWPERLWRQPEQAVEATVDELESAMLGDGDDDPDDEEPEEPEPVASSASEATGAGRG